MRHKLHFSFHRLKSFQRHIVVLVLALLVSDLAYHILVPDDHHDHSGGPLSIHAADYHPGESPWHSSDGDLGDGCVALHHHHYPAVLEAGSFTLPFSAMILAINEDSRLAGHPHFIKKQNRGPPSA